MNNSMEYLIDEIVKAEVWRLGCKKAFGKEYVDSNDMADTIMETGRKELYDNSTFGNKTLLSMSKQIETFEDYCKEKLHYKVESDYITQEVFIKAFEKELRDDYEAYKLEFGR